MTVLGSMRRSAYRLYQLLWTGLDWLYPPRCGGCESASVRWCQNCQAATQILAGARCQCCGEALLSVGICTRCQTSPPSFTAIRSWAEFSGPLRNALHRLKYKKDIALGEVLARPLIDLLIRLDWQVNLIAPVPLGIARQTQRGYNQASLLALPIALACGIPYRPQALFKVRETASQVGKTVTQRRENVAGAFQARRSLVNGKTILVVDDVTTSGATMEACAFALKREGASQVFGLTLARTVFNN